MNINKKFLTLAVSAVLALGVADYSSDAVATNNNSKSGGATAKICVDAKGNYTGSDSSSKRPDGTTDSSKGRRNENDSNFRGCGDSGKNSDSGKSKLKITVCHVPPGNPANAHTIHISANAWKAHQKHGGTLNGQYISDYLGSCNVEVKKTDIDTTGVATVTVKAGAGAVTTAEVSKTQLIVNPSDCKDTAKRTTLINKVQSYFEPVVIDDDVIADDGDAATAVSQCLDNGDSSDSTKPGKPDSSKKSDSGKHKLGGKGCGRDSVSDSTKKGGKKVHKIRGCLNKDSGKHKDDSTNKRASDSNKANGIHGFKSDSAKLFAKADSSKNFSCKLKGTDSGKDHSDSTKAKIAKDIKQREPIVVSDSALDDSGVFRAVSKCAGGKGGDSKKLDSSKMGHPSIKGDSGKNKSKGDSGHKQHEVKATNCGDSGKKADSLEKAVAAYKATKVEPAKVEKSTAPIVLNSASLTDVSILDALKDCGIPDPTAPGALPVAVTKTTIENPSIPDATFSSGGSIDTGGSVNGGSISGTVTGTISDGTVVGGGTPEVGSTVTVTNANVGNGSVTGATVDQVTVTSKNKDGTVNGTAISSPLTDGTINGGKVTPITDTSGFKTLVFTAETPSGTPAQQSEDGTKIPKPKADRKSWREINKTQ